MKVDAEATMAVTRTRMLRAGVELTAAGGLYGFSLADVAQRCGTSRSLLNHHFGSKKVFLDEVVGVLLAVDNSVDEQRDPLEVLAVDLSNELGAGLADNQLTRARLTVLASSAAATDYHEQIAMWWRAKRQGVARVLAPGTEAASAIRLSGTPPMCAVLLVSMVQGALLAACAMKPGAREEFRAATIDFALAALAPPRDSAAVASDEAEMARERAAARIAAKLKRGPDQENQQA